MAFQKLCFLSTLLLLLAFTAFETTQASYESEVEVVVEGMVYCQSCNRTGSWSLTGAEPIPSAKIGIVCKDYKGRVSFYKDFITNENGYFYAELKGFRMKHYYLDHPIQSCTVHLVYSPKPECNLLTNLNNGIDGSPLRYEKKKLSGENYQAVVYAAGPLAFRPSYCPAMTHQ
ncbi:Pollen Ole e 1 allergen/extensin [Cinnamomum micranthum f. kanehirae]|uniref:Pollen Ole e 1 allergen/extensin n=1 Tax=Cinnamomum micranthum f. kanehirae TaxID=337451 RepID=A0A3S3MFK0_9MAGN|nr:Pollen Ole e 1 allergen/extensin [Cinnamomum micranthum f. kanehirae]